MKEKQKERKRREQEQLYVTTTSSSSLGVTIKCMCSNQSCLQSLQTEYDFIVNCLKEADSILTRAKPGVQKDWWTRNLTDLRNKSVEVHSLWIHQGRPHQGSIHDERLRVRANYKHALRAAQRAPKQAAWDCQHLSLTQTLIDALACMRKGKSWDEDEISAEHLHNAPLIVFRLTNLFNLMLLHSFVPKQFRLGFMVPIVKNPQASHADASNYRGITISPIISKLFEQSLKIVFGNCRHIGLPIRY